MNRKGIITILAIAGAIVILSGAVFTGFLWGRNQGNASYGWFSRINPLFSAFHHRMPWSRWGWFRDDNRGFSTGQFLSIEDAEKAVNEYIHDFNSAEELHIGEIMIFDNHAYALVKEESTGIGAFEVLVDPSTQEVFPEMGPNMMWNLKYGHMRGGMRGSFSTNIVSDMPISSEEALDIANEYLRKNNSNMVAAGHPDPFYGYYTIHTTIDGEIFGMLSVNGYNGEVFIHTWHGKFIEMTEHIEDAHSD